MCSTIAPTCRINDLIDSNCAMLIISSFLLIIYWLTRVYKYQLKSFCLLLYVTLNFSPSCVVRFACLRFGIFFIVSGTTCPTLRSLLGPLPRAFFWCCFSPPTLVLVTPLWAPALFSCSTGTVKKFPMWSTLVFSLLFIFSFPCFWCLHHVIWIIPLYSGYIESKKQWPYCSKRFSPNCSPMD